MQQALLRALEAKSWPEDEGKMASWMRTLADRALVDDLRKRQRRSDIEESHADVDVVDERPDDEEAKHVVEVAAQIGKTSARHAATLEMIHAQAAGHSVQEIAEQWKISPDAFHRRKQSFVAALRKRLVAIASVTTGAFALLFLVHMLTVMSVATVGDASQIPSTSESLPTVSQHERAEVIRRTAVTACRSADYGRCLELLDRAKNIDPAGESEPAVRSMRDQASSALGQGAPPRLP